MGITVGKSYDRSAAEFFNAAQTLTVLQKEAVNTLVTDLKIYNLWDKMKAVYPMVGQADISGSFSYNLKNPNTFRGTFSGSWTFSSTGATPDGISAYMNTTVVPSINLSQNSNHLSFYSRTNNIASTSIEIGSLNTSPASYFHSHIYYTSNQYYMLLAQSTSVSVSNTNSLGFFNGNRKNSTTVSHFKNGSNISDLTPTSVELNNRSIYIGAGNINGVAAQFSNRQCAFASIGDGLTDTDASNFYTAVQAFQTTLGRQV